MWTKNNIPDQTGKTAIVTGANTGIGFETALALYEAGTNVILACRNLHNAETAAAAIKQQKGKGLLETAIIDLSSLASVKKFADAFIKQHSQLDYLINNAGVMMSPESKTSEGYELQFGTNFLGHFALTGRLYPLLNATSGSRIVTVSSMAYLRGTIDFDNLKSEKSYDPVREYAQSKLANLIFAIELERRIVANGGKTISVGAQPGANKTELARHMDPAAFNAAVERIGALMDPWQGALPSLYAAISPDITGAELISPDQDGGYRGYPAKAAITDNALDEFVAKRLWDFAEGATGIRYPA